MTTSTHSVPDEAWPHAPTHAPPHALTPVPASAHASAPAPVAVPTSASTPEPTPALWVERVGDKTYVGRNERGAVVEIGTLARDGVFSPGELLKIALAACTAMSAERPVLRRLGTDGPVHAGVSSVKDEAQDRYSALLTELVLPLAGLPEDQQAELREVATAAVSAHCTVGRTLEAGADVTLMISDEA